MKVWFFSAIMVLTCGMGAALVLSGCTASEDGTSYDASSFEAFTCSDHDLDGFFEQEGCGTLVDCDDEDAAVNAGVTESAAGDSMCGDGIDNDCDDLTDEQDNGCQSCTADGDCDDGNSCTDDACVAAACQYTDNTDPCDDGDDCTQDDTCSGGVCSGVARDADGDGYPDETCGGDDCNDSDPDLNPGATEGPAGGATCSDNMDNDCDGFVDDDDDGCQGAVPAISVGTINPLGVVRYEDDPALSAYTLVTNGYDTAMNQSSEVFLLHNDTQLALWVYNASDLGGLDFAHNADLLGDEMIISDTGNDRVFIVQAANGITSDDPDFQPVWNSDDDAAFRLDYPNDANFLSNGNLLITDRDRHRVIEVDRDTGTIVWQFGVTNQTGSDDTHLNGPHNADRLSNGNTIIADSNNNRILEVDSAGGLVWEYAPSGWDSLSWPRDSDALDNGNVLIADSRKGRVIEVTEAGSTVWEYTINMIGTMSQPYEADLLDNGNVLISCPGMGTGTIYEVDYSTQTVVWSFN